MTAAVLNKLSRSILAVAAFAAAGGAIAATQPTNATTAAVTINTALLAANSIQIGSVGGATIVGSTLNLPVSNVTTAVNGGAATINFGDADGFILTTAFGTLTFKDFSFDAATNSLFGDLVGGSTGLISFLGIDYADKALLTATNVTGAVGTDSITAVSNSAVSRDLYLRASQFTIAPSLATYLSTKGLNASQIPVGDVVQSVAIGSAPTPAVPEPSTYALMGVGLVGVGLMARRNKAA